MRIDVLNGVNLNLLGRRDQAIYGDQSIQDLETQIYAWARELDLQVRCRQTNHEGEYVGFLHQALGTADGLIVNPGAWTHYSWAIHDALEPFDGTVRRGAPVQRRRARGVAPPLGARRARRDADRRQGLRRATARRSTS